MRLLVLLLLLTPAVVRAQGTGTLAGRVLDNTGMGLPGANVVLDGTTMGAATDADGRYRIIGIPVGTYAVTVSFTGYPPETRSVTVTDGGTGWAGFLLFVDEGVGDTVFVCGYCPSALMNYDPFASRVVGDGCGASVWLSDMPVER